MKGKWYLIFNIPNLEEEKNEKPEYVSVELTYIESVCSFQFIKFIYIISQLQQ